VRNTADFKGGKLIAARSQSVSGISAVNPLVAFYEIHGRKGQVVFFCFAPDTIRDKYVYFLEQEGSSRNLIFTV
jgi:hypothetical protein